jgi:hypothetical protein
VTDAPTTARCLLGTLCLVGIRLALAGVAVAACSFQPGANVSPGEQADAALAGRDSGSSGSDAASTHGSGSDAAGRTPDASEVGQWTCGSTAPASPGNVSDTPSGADLAMTQIDVTGGVAGGGMGSGQVVVVSANVQVDLSLHFTLTDSRCENCTDQLEVGWMQGTTGPRSGCAWDGSVGSGVTEVVTNFQITTPTTTGGYDLRTNIGQADSCGGGSWFANEVPAANTTIVKICVQ